ncbi:MAG: hypothetical protein ABJD38_09650 [Aurantimonas coralicida]
MSTTATVSRPLALRVGRVFLLAAGYAIGTVAAIGGFVAFSSTGDLEALMSRGTVMVLGGLLLYGVRAVQVATRPNRKPDPSNPSHP